MAMKMHHMPNDHNELHVSFTFLLSGAYRNDGGAATCRWWRWQTGWQPFCVYRAQTHWFLCLIIDRASTQRSDGREVILTGGSTARGGAAFCHHGDLGAEVEAVACHRGLLVLGVSPQKSLHVPPPPLPFDLRLDLESVCMRSVKYLYFSQIIFARECF